MNTANGMSNTSNQSLSSAWVAVKKALIAVTIFTGVITVFATGGKLFDYVSSIGNYSQTGKLYELLKWIVATIFVFWLVNRAILMGRVDKIAKEMQVPRFFEPKKDDQTTQVVPGSYIGIDFDTGVIGVAAAYATGQNNKRVTYFECNLIETYDYYNDHLILNLRNRQVPSLSIPVKDGQQMFRKIEQLSQLGTVHASRRAVEPYQTAKESFLKEAIMIKADY